MADKYLDKDGLIHLWGKINNKLGINIESLTITARAIGTYLNSIVSKGSGRFYFKTTEGMLFEVTQSVASLSGSYYIGDINKNPNSPMPSTTTSSVPEVSPTIVTQKVFGNLDISGTTIVGYDSNLNISPVNIAIRSAKSTDLTQASWILIDKV